VTWCDRSTLIRWLKFNLVGAVGVLVQVIALFVLKSVLHVDYLLATALAVEFTVLHNFVWHERYTWLYRTGKDQPLLPRKWPARLLRFNISNGTVSIVGNLALMKLLAGVWHVNYLLANGIAIGICSLLNFVASEQWVFQ
jgi:putative flippase GtrA